jgi:hypothetical protein
MKLAAGAAAVLALAVAAPLAGATRALAPCTGSMLTGTFKVVLGSPGAGNIVYRLRVTPTGANQCFVTGVPRLTLLNLHGQKLPTNAAFSGNPGELTAIMVPLTPGRAAALTARFSPDVPGPGEPVTKGPCEPTAYKVRVAPSGGGSFVVKITPPTPVCEHGGMGLSVFSPA